MAYTNLGNVYSGLGDYIKSQEYYGRSLSIAKNTGNEGEMAYLYGRLAIAFLNLGDTKNAMKYANLHLTCAKEMGIKDMEGVRAASLLITSLETLISL